MNFLYHQIQEMKSPSGDNFRFKLLFKVENVVLITTHSNVGMEQVIKNEPEKSGRNRVDINGTLLFILCVKLGRPDSTCTWYNFNPSQTLQESAKKPTRTYNEEHIATLPKYRILALKRLEMLQLFMVAFEKLFINKLKNKMIINCFLKCSLDDPCDEKRFCISRIRE